MHPTRYLQSHHLSLPSSQQLILDGIYTRGILDQKFSWRHQSPISFMTFYIRRYGLKAICKNPRLKTQFETYHLQYTQAACQCKLSVLFFSKRLIGRANIGSFRIHFVILVLLITIVSLCEVLFIIFSFVLCQYVSNPDGTQDHSLMMTNSDPFSNSRPVKVNWDPHPNYPYKCGNSNAFLMIAGLINTIMDFCCTLLPAFVVIRLQMPKKEKFAISSVFLAGIVVNVASILRIYYGVVQARTKDSWYFFATNIAGDFEIGLGMV